MITHHFDKLNVVVYSRELLQQHPSNLRTLLTHTIYNELSQSRNPNNMSLLTVMFQFSSDHSARVSETYFYQALPSLTNLFALLDILSLHEVPRFSNWRLE